MASPQTDNKVNSLKNGFTKFPNDFIDAILKSILTQRELKILMFIARLTFGFNRDNWELSLRFCEKSTGILYHNVSTTYKSLLNKNTIIDYNSNSQIQGRIIGINTDYETWKCYQTDNSYQDNNCYQNSVPGVINLVDNIENTVTNPITKKEIFLNKDLKKDTPKPEKKIFPDDSNEYKLSILLLDLILERDPKHTLPNMQTWAEHIDAIIRLDQRNPDEIENVIRWSQRDNFWRNNILSTDKLRKQFDKLYLHMIEGKNGSGRKHYQATDSKFSVIG